MPYLLLKPAALTVDHYGLQAGRKPLFHCPPGTALYPRAHEKFSDGSKEGRFALLRKWESALRRAAWRAGAGAAAGVGLPSRCRTAAQDGFCSHRIFGFSITVTWAFMLFCSTTESVTSLGPGIHIFFTISQD